MKTGSGQGQVQLSGVQVAADHNDHLSFTVQNHTQTTILKGRYRGIWFLHKVFVFCVTCNNSSQGKIETIQAVSLIKTELRISTCRIYTAATLTVNVTNILWLTQLYTTYHKPPLSIAWRKPTWTIPQKWGIWYVHVCILRGWGISHTCVLEGNVVHLYFNSCVYEISVTFVHF